MPADVLSSVLPFVVWFAGTVAVGYLVVYWFKHRVATEKTPLVRFLLHGPGEPLRRRLVAIDAKLDLYLLLLLFSPPLLAALLLARQATCAPSRFPFSWLIFFILALAVLLVAALFISMLRLLAERRRQAFALDCHQAVGQELNLLMRSGYGVFHGFPAEGYCIDHVLVGPAGVYAVATEGRSRPRQRQSGEERVFYDGKTLSFPGWQETGPVARVGQQADWLADWLTRVVGEPVSVKGVVFLPGWIVEASGRHAVSVINEQSASLLANPRGEQALDAESVQRIAYQIEQRCRNMTGDGC